MDTSIQLTLNGLTLGSVYALIALGYSLVYGILALELRPRRRVHRRPVHRLRRAPAAWRLRRPRGSPPRLLLVLTTPRRDGRVRGARRRGSSASRSRPLRDAPRIAPLISAPASPSSSPTRCSSCSGPSSATTTRSRWGRACSSSRGFDIGNVRVPLLRIDHHRLRVRADGCSGCSSTGRGPARR